MALVVGLERPLETLAELGEIGRLLRADVVEQFATDVLEASFAAPGSRHVQGIVARAFLDDRDTDLDLLDRFGFALVDAHVLGQVGRELALEGFELEREEEEDQECLGKSE